MRALIKKINESVDAFPKEEKKEILKFTKRLESYIHVPTNKKEVERMLPFAHKDYLIDYILKNINDYKYPEKSEYPFDIISYWYCLALFVQSERKEAKNFVQNLIEKFLNSEHEDLWQFRRFLSAFESTTEYDKAKETIENYFLSKQDSLESYLWAKEIGLELPSDNNWILFFEISTDGEFRFGNDLSEEEKERRLVIKTSAYPLQGKKCWEIELNNWNNSISAWWPNLSEREVIIDNKKNYYLKTMPSLRNLKELIQELEDHFAINFKRQIYLKTFKGKIKNKNAVQKWLLE